MSPIFLSDRCKEEMKASRGSMAKISNLSRFLNITTPRVRSQILPKASVDDLKEKWPPILVDRKEIDYFNLGDLWNCYDEWSVYGVGCPFIDGSNSERISVQYFIPYLSAIQIYTDKSIPRIQRRDDIITDGEFELIKSSSCSSESEEEEDKYSLLSRSSSSSNSDKTWDIMMDDSSKKHLGQLYFQYFEQDIPFGRVPLKDKIDVLARKYPHLNSFNSVDLSPASWMAVAWYPIYNIPASRNSKDSYAAFLTYHTLSSCFQVEKYDDDDDDDDDDDGVKEMEVDCQEESNRISLDPFGISTYRMQSRAWLNSKRGLDHERVGLLKSAADSWLKQLRVQHPDFNFFNSHSSRV